MPAFPSIFRFCSCKNDKEEKKMWSRGILQQKGPTENALLTDLSRPDPS